MIFVIACGTVVFKGPLIINTDHNLVRRELPHGQVKLNGRFGNIVFFWLHIPHVCSAVYAINIGGITVMLNGHGNRANGMCANFLCGAFEWETSATPSSPILLSSTLMT